MKCIVKNCNNKPFKSKAKLLYFKFPNDKAYKWLWLKAIGAPPNYIVTRKDHICSKHFKPSDFIRVSRRRKTLRDCAVPNMDFYQRENKRVNKMSDDVIEIKGEDGDSDCEIIPGPEVSVVEVEDSQDENSDNEENSSNSEEEESENLEDSENSEDGINKEIKHEQENVGQECMNQENQIETEIRHNSEQLIQEIQSSQDELVIEIQTTQEESIQEIQTTQEESIQEIQTTQEESIQEIQTTQETRGTQEEQLTWEIHTTQEEELTQGTRQIQQEQLIHEIQDTQETQQTDETQGTQKSTFDSGYNHAILLRMCFSNENNFLNLKDCVMAALSSCLKQKGINIDFIENENIFDICVYKKPISTNEMQQNDEQEIVNISDNLCFQIDTTPQQNLDRKAIPCYKRSRKEVLNENNKKIKIDPDECKRPMTNSCFNCLGNHSLKDCPQPRNQQRINRNRKAYASKGERYHVEGRQKYAHLKPGQLSDNLKKALGLRNGEIPSFYYKMRLLGYPPGWLEEAKITHSGLTLFDSEGRRVLESDEEDGEVDVVRYKYDVDKIISFPGYNVYPGSDYFDDYRYHGVPPMLPKFSKEEFIKSLGDENIQKGYKRKKLKDLTANTSGSETVTIQDMEIEDIENSIPQIFNHPPPPPLPPPLPEDPAPLLPPPPPPPIEEVNSQNIIRIEDKEEGELEEYSRDSLSLAELEEKQKQLLAALNNSSIILDSSIDEQQQQEQTVIIDVDEIITTTTIEDNSQESLTKDSNSNENLSQENQINSENSNLNNSQINSLSQNDIIGNIYDCPSTSTAIFSESYNTPNSSQTSQLTTKTITTTTPISTTQGSSKEKLLGTPVLKFSPYDKLPSGDKFSVGVSDVINFENLADSTGKYEKMKKVLQKIRKKQLNMNE